MAIKELRSMCMEDTRLTMEQWHLNWLGVGTDSYLSVLSLFFFISLLIFEAAKRCRLQFAKIPLKEKEIIHFSQFYGIQCARDFSALQLIIKALAVVITSNYISPKIKSPNSSSFVRLLIASQNDTVRPTIDCLVLHCQRQHIFILRRLETM